MTDISRFTFALCVGIGAFVLIAFVAIAQEPKASYEIVQSRGVDQSVDYASLTKYGPWDDRNYNLTAQDLEYLSPDEHELRNGLPAFFRVELRKEMPHLRRSGPAQYPRAALNLFEHRYGGIKRESTVTDDGQRSESSENCNKAKKNHQE